MGNMKILYIETDLKLFRKKKFFIYRDLHPEKTELFSLFKISSSDYDQGVFRSLQSEGTLPPGLSTEMFTASITIFPPMVQSDPMLSLSVVPA